MKLFNKLLFVFLCLLFFFCKKEGTTGSTAIATLVKHHEKSIPFATVYIKYNAKEFPGEDLSKYNDSKVTDKQGHVHFENLQKGDYYFYAVGYDSSIAAPVRGGTPCKIIRKDKDKHIDFVVAVTE